MGKNETYGSLLDAMFMGVFLKVEILLASSPTSLVDT